MSGGLNKAVWWQRGQEGGKRELEGRWFRAGLATLGTLAFTLKAGGGGALEQMGNIEMDWRWKGWEKQEPRLRGTSRNPVSGNDGLD